MTDWIIAVVVGIAVFAASWFGGRRSVKTAVKLKGLEEYVDTREKLDQVGRMSDADAARAWLRERGKQDGDL